MTFFNLPLKNVADFSYGYKKNRNLISDFNDFTNHYERRNGWWRSGMAFEFHVKHFTCRIFLVKISLFIFKMKTVCVFCEVGTESLFVYNIRPKRIKFHSKRWLQRRREGRIRSMKSFNDITLNRSQGSKSGSPWTSWLNITKFRHYEPVSMYHSGSL